MSHETIEPGRAAFYHVPRGFSDVLRAREFMEFFKHYYGPAFAVRTRDGWAWSSSSRAPQFTVTFGTRDALDSVICDARETTLGRLFLDGELDLEGNLFILLSVVQYTLSHSDGMSHGLVQTVTRLSHTLSRRIVPLQKNPAHPSWHCAPNLLSLPVSFFRPWLGDLLGHTCACLSGGDDDMDAAQQSSLNRACEWLGLERGDRFLEVGCGWGTLLVLAAEQHGASAHGLVSTDAQAAAAMERICRSRLLGKCSVSRGNLGKILPGTDQFDKIADIGIFEQIAPSQFSDYMRSVQRLLAPGGTLLIHRLTRSPQAGPIIRSLESELLSGSLSRELQIAESSGFELVRMESLHNEYEHTLRLWIDRLLRFRLSEDARIFSRNYRAWLLYLVEIASCLQAGEVQLHRVLLRRTATPVKTRSQHWIF